jgi:HAMP domain-containing protein
MSTRSQSGVEGQPERGKAAADHVNERSTWIRLVYMLILAVAWTLAEFVFVAIAVLQFLAKLFTGQPLDNLVDFARDLAEYMAEIVRFQTFVTEELAFPFAPWPSAKGKRASR